MSLYSDIRAELLADATLSTEYGNRMYQRKPLSEGNSPYITFIRQDARNASECDERIRIRFTLFHTDQDLLESTSIALRDLFYNKTSVNSNAKFYKTYFLNQTDGTERLKQGFYWNMLDFEFAYTPS